MNNHQKNKIDIICPLYDGKKHIVNLHQSILKQKDICINKIRYVLTDTNDGSEQVLKKLDKCMYRVISTSDFSHSLTREEEAFASDAEIIVFITQDIVIERDDWLKNLVRPICNGTCEASYSRQICSNHSIERYTREYNYPDYSYVKTKDSLADLGFHLFFFSDASSAIRLDVFKRLHGFDGRRLTSNEDEYFAFKLIMNGYRIMYCADSVVNHSHEFTLRQLYKRYYDTGGFFRDNPEMIKYKPESAGSGMAKYILRRALEEKNWSVILSFIPNMAARYIGMKAGSQMNSKR